MKKQIVVLAALLVSTTMLSAESVAAPAKLSAGWEKGRPLYDVVQKYMGDYLEHALVPTPKQVVYANKLFEMGKAVIVYPDTYPHKGTRRDLTKILPGVQHVSAGAWKKDPSIKLLITVGGPERNPVSKKFIEKFGATLTPEQKKQLGKEGYLLFVSADTGGKVVVVLAGNNPAGDFWAVQSLRQLIAEKDAKRFVAGIWTIDWPSFSARGVKGNRRYMPQYKDNFSWSGFKEQNTVDNFGWYVPLYAPGTELDCRDANLDHLAGEFKKHFQRGVRHFCIKFDDVGMKLQKGFLLKREDLLDVPGLCQLLVSAEMGEKDGSDDIAELLDEAAASPADRINELLDKKTKGLLLGAVKRKDFSARVIKELMAGLNKILGNTGFYSKAHFERIKLPTATAKLLTQRKKLSREALQKLNRLLLEAALPKHFLPCPAEDTLTRFKTYGPAICYFLKELDKRAKQLSPDCRLFYMPQDYSGRGETKVSKLIKEAGGLPKDIAMAWCGPGVFSPNLSVKSIKGYMEAHGATQSKGIIYDNYARHAKANSSRSKFGDHFTFSKKGHPAELTRYLIGVFTENATMMHRITRTDWNWNPEAYDETRALKLACREMAGPKGYAALLKFLQYMDTVNPKRVMATSNRLFIFNQANLSYEELKKIADHEKELLPSLLKKLDGVPMMDKDLYTELKEMAAWRGRMAEKTLLAKKHQRTTTIAKTSAAITVDGVLDEAAWKSGGKLKDFFKYGKAEKAVSKTQGYLLHDDKKLYMGLIMKTDEFSGPVKKGILSGKDSMDYHGRIHGFRPTSKELIAFILNTDYDPDNGKLLYIINPDGHRADVNWLDSRLGKKSGAFDSAWQVKVAKGAGQWSFEAAIPIEKVKLVDVKPGAKWLLNIIRDTGKERSTWALSVDKYNPNYAGDIVFE
ncbi:MAG: beta-N-acetylglucosaminidase domain-containing protein [Lentisphaeria bacterium]|nr:beta-N-acetylglucosaminidase domain-containing protein [Lentisphaeria bacterium]